MKKLFVVLAMLSLLSGAAFAGSQANANTGCGLGKVIFKDQGDGLVIQVLQSTTNGTFLNQTFGITFGTLECKKPGVVVQNEQLNQFVQNNLDALAQDIAQGSGEQLTTLAELMQVNDVDTFGKTLQANFDVIFPSSGVEYSSVVETIVRISA